ncbi:uncharacterized protein LOC127872767 [Dreissena polymorpha]|uniref:B box-type domain-containing protein n=1 Tax=Dreissena polymorpha TaxID=45954 RepID=A0A9D4QVB9_DREPO|nr:uncharacterized protein LOC127872767 [Dreissena polymorpha]KAH3844318.1 hypothetical protein DPMN_086576 [Dreissena polymorpha]
MQCHYANPVLEINLLRQPPFSADCTELFCDQCSHLHTIFKPGKYDIISVADMDSVRVRVDMKGMDVCQEHDKKIKFYCQDHSKLCCSTCAFIHRKCEHVDELSSLSEQTRPELDALKESLQQIESDAEYIIDECKKSENDLNESIANMSVEVDEIQTRFNKLFENAKTTMLTEANGVKSKEMKKLDDRSAETTKLKEEITQLLPICVTLLEHGTPQQMFILSKYIDEKDHIMKASISAQQEVKLKQKLSVSFPRGLYELLELGENVMKLNSERKKTDQASPDCPSTLSRPVTLELIVSVDLPKTGDDEDYPFLTGLDFLPDGRLVAVDNTNCKCIIFNELLQIQGSPYTFQSNPFSVCACQNGLAVTGFDNTLHLLSVSSNNVISLKREIGTSSQFDSICHKTPSVMVVSAAKYQHPARMITMDGVELDFDRVEFPKKEYNIEESMCTYVQYNNTLVLTDRDAHTVNMYDIMKGTSRAVTDGNIQKPGNVCVGPGDTVMVCSSLNNSIVHLTVTGEILGTYLVDIGYLQSLSMSKDGTKLAVSNNVEGMNKLQLYKISHT